MCTFNQRITGSFIVSLALLGALLPISNTVAEVMPTNENTSTAVSSAADPTAAPSSSSYEVAQKPSLSRDNKMISSLELFGKYLGMSDTDPRLIAARLIRVGFGFVGIIFTLMILMSGLRYMVSGGDQEKIDSAKATFYRALVGLVIIFLAYSIVIFVTNALATASA